ncbi:MAG TPA: hypothetical protein VMY15_06275 [Candidatus Latescibacteria bacterium]|nr:hypothetical protein [Candidatus Latescibacterota bacterium]
MEGLELLARMNRVTAPAGFEEGVLAKLAAARKERARIRRANFRYAFAGSAALVLVGFFLLNPSLFQKEQILTFAGRETPAVPSIPVFETMDYASEFRNAQSQPRTVYILEQVSESVSSEIIY